MATTATTTYTFTNFNRVPKPWAGGPILLPDKVSVQVGYASAANLAPKPFSALDAANSAAGLYSAQNVAAAAASQGAVKTDLSTLRQTVVPINVSENVALEDPRSIPSPSQQQGSSSSNVPVWSNRNPRNIYANPVPNYCWTHYHVDFPPTRYEDVDQTPVRIENLPSRGSFRKNPAHQVHVPDRLRLRGGVIEDEDGGVVTENLHKPSQEKYNPHFSGSTIQSRSFHILEENLAAEGDLGPPPTTIDYQTGELILKRDAPAPAPVEAPGVRS